MEYVEHGHIVELASGETVNARARGSRQKPEGKITIITDAASSATISRVNSHDADEHETDGASEDQVSANSLKVLDVDWPFYHISCDSGTCRVAMI